MATINDFELNDYYANATGAALGFITPEWKGLQVGVKGLFTFNTFSSDLNRTDSLSHGSAGWK